jgi:chloride channel 3/4/5
MSRDVDTIKLDEKNTVMGLRDKLLALTMSGNEDGGFPILRMDNNEDGARMVGYIGASELEHALSKVSLFMQGGDLTELRHSGIVADLDADKEVRFQANYIHNLAASSVSSLLDGHHRPKSTVDPFDFSIYMDQVCSLAI